jgi:type III restriction enzyme
MSGSLMSHFSGLTDEMLKEVERLEDGSPVHSLVNVFRIRKPVVIVDEAHNARTSLSFATLARFRPSCILELTATPNTQGDEENPPSNVLYSVSAAELKFEEMIKLPIRLKTRANWKELLGRRSELEADSKKVLSLTRLKQVSMFARSCSCRPSQEAKNMKLSQLMWLKDASWRNSEYHKSR